MIRKLLAGLALAALVGGPAAAQTAILRKPDNTGAYQAATTEQAEALKSGIGAPTDAAYSGSGSSSLIGLDKYIAAKTEAMRALLAGTLSVQFASTPTVNLGTLNGAATAANQSTANASLSSIDTKLTGVASAANQSTTNTNLGAPSDAAWSGSGNGNITSVLKALWTALTGTVKTTVYDGSGVPVTYPNPAPVALPADAVYTCTAVANGDMTCIPSSPIFVSGYAIASVYVNSVGGGATITYNQSETATGTYTAVTGLNMQNTAQGFSSSTSAGNEQVISLKKSWLKFVVSNYTSGTVSITVNLRATPVTPPSNAVNGQSNDGESARNGVMIACEARTSSKTAVANNTTVRQIATPDGRCVTLPYAIPENTWSYPAASGGIANTTTAVTIKGAVSGVRNYLQSCVVDHDALGGATEIVWRDGAGGTVLARRKLQTSAIEGVAYRFEPPLRGSVNTLMEFATVNAVTGAVYVNCQGYVGPN